MILLAYYLDYFQDQLSPGDGKSVGSDHLSQHHREKQSYIQATPEAIQVK